MDLDVDVAPTRDLGSELIPLVPGVRYKIDKNIINLTFSNDVSLDLVVDAAPGCGGIVWPAGQILANHLVKQGPESLRGQNVLELGSGTGLVGLVAALLGGRAWITDQTPLLDIMSKNVALNQLSSSCTVAELNWGEPIPSDVPEPDLLLLADCVYFEPAFPLLVQTLDDLVGTKTRVLFCYKKRRKADKRFFLLLKKKFKWTDIMDSDRDIYSKESISLLEITRIK